MAGPEPRGPAASPQGRCSTVRSGSRREGDRASWEPSLAALLSLPAAPRPAVQRAQGGASTLPTPRRGARSPTARCASTCAACTFSAAAGGRASGALVEGVDVFRRSQAGKQWAAGTERCRADQGWLLCAYLGQAWSQPVDWRRRAPTAAAAAAAHTGQPPSTPHPPTPHTPPYPPPARSWVCVPMDDVQSFGSSGRFLQLTYASGPVGRWGRPRPAAPHDPPRCPGAAPPAAWATRWTVCAACQGPACAGVVPATCARAVLPRRLLGHPRLPAGLHPGQRA